MLQSPCKGHIVWFSAASYIESKAPKRDIPSVQCGKKAKQCNRNAISNHIFILKCRGIQPCYIRSWQAGVSDQTQVCYCIYLKTGLNDGEWDEHHGSEGASCGSDRQSLKGCDILVGLSARGRGKGGEKYSLQDSQTITKLPSFSALSPTIAPNWTIMVYTCIYYYRCMHMASTCTAPGPPMVTIVLCQLQSSPPETSSTK